MPATGPAKLVAGRTAPSAATLAKSTEQRALTIRVLDELNVEATPENIAQMRVFLQAFDIFVQRNKRHQAGWRVAGVKGIMVDIRKKVERMWTEYMLADERPSDADSALDCINYSAFLVQAVDEEETTGNPVGNWKWS
jgi:hypothetical protein